MRFSFSEEISRQCRTTVFGALAGVVGLVMLVTPAMSAAPFISIVSGSSGTNNETIDNNGTVTTTNGVSVAFSDAGPTIGGTAYSGYDLTAHILGTTSTPTTSGFTGTAFVSDNGSGTYDGGPASLTAPNGTVLTSANISGFPSGSTNGDTGYYMYTVTFSVSSATNDPFTIVGFADGDNEIQDAILDYGTKTVNGSLVQTGTVLGISAVNNTEIQTTNNAPSNAQFQTTTAATNLAGTHTLSVIVYNHDGPTDVDFGFTALAVPEPAVLALLGAGLPLFSVLGRRRAMGG